MAKLYQFFSNAITDAGIALRDKGYIIHTDRWQGKNIRDDEKYKMQELFNHSFSANILPVQDLVREIKPSLPWADLHFNERVSGIPYNPPPSHELWPYKQDGNKEFTKGDNQFSHTYPERLWPKQAGALREDRNKGFEYRQYPNMGIRYAFGDLQDVINLLKADPYTRQAFIPIFFPEDTGAIQGQRIPCTIGYHLMMRHDFLHIIYYIRSCDYFRHFRDDIYMACKLVHWALQELTKESPMWEVVQPGTFTIHISSLHCWASEVRLLR